jgi:hypothetical protein
LPIPDGLELDDDLFPLGSMAGVATNPAAGHTISQRLFRQVVEHVDQIL